MAKKPKNPLYKKPSRWEGPPSALPPSKPRPAAQVSSDTQKPRAQKQTATGKTAAFALPMIQKSDSARMETQALVLEPTRELAIQVAGGIHDLAKHTGLRVVPVYGGQPLDRQFRALRDGAQIVVGTPG